MYQFRIAQSDDELDQIARLLHATFVVEVPRYRSDEGGERLTDRFHHKNRYLVAKSGGRVCGMIALHDQPPFSAADLLDEPLALLSLAPRMVEARILAVRPEDRRGSVFIGLAWAVYEFARAGGYRYVAASGLAARRAMYEQMGFAVLGPARPRGGDCYFPMLLDVEALPGPAERIVARCRRRFGSALVLQCEVAE